MVGAGPGDPGLLTLHALNALGAADIIVYDALVDPRILALAPPETPRRYAGKRGGKPSAAQGDISESLIALARAGRRVLRLKGGDPFVFGRGGEEALALVAAGIRFRIVPGVSSGLAALALHGVLATARSGSARALGKRAEEQPTFIAAVNGLLGGALVPVPGGVLVRDGDGRLIGAVGIFGDTSDHDEAAAIAGIRAVGLRPDAG